MIATLAVLLIFAGLIGWAFVAGANRKPTPPMDEEEPPDVPYEGPLRWQ